MNSPVSPSEEAWLRSRFAEPRTVSPIAAGDGHLWRGPEEIRPAAVLVPVVRREGGLTVLLTRRTAHLNDHAGQISFPGGRAEPGDADAAQTALREAAEEIGLERERVEVLGELHPYVTVTGYRVTPVVGLVTPPLDLRPDDFGKPPAQQSPERRPRTLLLRHAVPAVLHLGGYGGNADELLCVSDRLMPGRLQIES